MSMSFRSFALISALPCCSLAASTPLKSLIRGVSYGPVPLKSVDGAGALPGDDWFCDEAVPMWGSSGRGDLKIIKDLGANLVRLYGNNPANDHTNFLDEAHALGLAVAPGMSDWPYYQQTPGNCMHTTDFDCFSQVKPLYLQNLQKGFLTMAGSYHPALKVMNILNEPDLKMPPTATIGTLEDVFQMCRAIISAFDAMLDAEKDAGVTGPLINFTATFSYAICQSCDSFTDKPALGQISQLDDAMHNPTKYGYTPRNNITEAYRTRFTHSFNTQNPATDLESQFLAQYAVSFPTTPVYIGEYHRVAANQSEDLELILSLAESDPLFLGISYFEYQVAYWKTGSEMDFGMFGLGSFVDASMPYFSQTYDIYCLVPQDSVESGTTLPQAVAQAFGGVGIDAGALCVANPLGVPLNSTGWEAIAAQNSAIQMAAFVTRMLNHLGKTVKVGAEDQLLAFAQRFARPSADFAQMASELGSVNAWVSSDPNARCVVDRTANPTVVGEAIGWICANSALNCTDLPSECNTSAYKMGDFLFSRYYASLGQVSNPLLACSFEGAGMFAPAEVYSQWTGAPECSALGMGIATTTPAAGSSNGSATTGRSFLGSATLSSPSALSACLWLVSLLAAQAISAAGLAPF